MIRRRLSALGMWTTGVVLVLGVWATCEAVAAEPARPVTAGAEGQRAFADLARYYQERQEPPPVDQVLQELESADPAERARSGKYLLALLAQSQADETNGRGNWGRQGLPAWGSGLESDAHAFRVSLADKLASRITAAEALDLAVWLLEQDTSPDVEKAGVTLLCRIKSQQVASVFQRLLRQPHPNQSVLIAVLEQVAERKLVGLVPEVRHLALHHRAVVRTAASKAAKALEVGEVPEYRPEEALTPWLDGLLKNIAAMVEGGVPQAAKWNKFTVTYPPSETSGEPSVASTRGWLLSEDSDNVQILSWLGSRYGLPKGANEAGTVHACGNRPDIAEHPKESRRGNFRRRSGHIVAHGQLQHSLSPATSTCPRASSPHGCTSAATSGWQPNCFSLASMPLKTTAGLAGLFATCWATSIIRRCCMLLLTSAITNARSS